MLYKKTNPFLFIIIIILHMYCITCIHKKIHNIGIDGYKNLKKFFLETVLIIYIKSVIPPYNMRIKNVGWYINADLKLKFTKLIVHLVIPHVGQIQSYFWRNIHVGNISNKLNLTNKIISTPIIAKITWSTNIFFILLFLFIIALKLQKHLIQQSLQAKYISSIK